MLILVTPDSNLAHFPLCLNHKSQQSPVLFSRPRSTCNFCFSRSVHRPSVLYGNVIFGVIDPQVHHNVFFIRLKLEHYSFSLQILFGTFLCSGVPWNICEIRAMAKRATLLQFFFFLTALRRFVQWRDTMTVHTWLIWNCADSFPWEKKNHHLLPIQCLDEQKMNAIIRRVDVRSCFCAHLVWAAENKVYKNDSSQGFQWRRGTYSLLDRVIKYCYDRTEPRDLWKVSRKKETPSMRSDRQRNSADLRPKDCRGVK